MEPPSPTCAAPRPKASCEPRSMEAASQGCNSGAFQPAPALSTVQVMRAP